MNEKVRAPRTFAEQKQVGRLAKRTIFARPYASELTTAFVRNANPISSIKRVQTSKFSLSKAIKNLYGKMPCLTSFRHGRARHTMRPQSKFASKFRDVYATHKDCQQNKKDTRVSVLFDLLVTRTGIEPMLQP